MKKGMLFILMFILSFGLVACDSLEPNDSNDGNQTETPDPDPKPIINNGIEYLTSNDELYNEFFDINSKVIIKIEIDESELALIQKDYEHYSSFGSKSPIYRKADVTFIINDVEYFYEEVGIRMKGNTSRRNFYDVTDGINDLIHYKLSFSQTFDKEDRYENPKVWDEVARKNRKNRLFAGMEKLDLKWNKSLDETYTREYWTYSMYQEFGVLAPNIVPVNVNLNYRDKDENLGVFYAVETIDEYFLEKRLAKKHLGGDLYKVGWGSNMGGELTTRTLDFIGVEDEELGHFPIYDLKTNKKKSDFSILKNLINTLDTSDDLSEVVNLGYYLNYEAISYLVGNPDDMRNNYNNYYIYFLKDSNQAIFIPYDFDRSFGITHEWNPTGNAMTSFSPYSKRVSVDADNPNSQVNPLILKTIAKGGNMELILEYRKIIINGKNSKYFDINEFYKVYEINKKKYQNKTQSSISSLINKNVDFAKNENKNMAISEYLTKKLATINDSIDSYQ